MDRRLLDYLPPVLRDVMEFQAINAANEPEISLAWDALASVMANQFLETADERGVSMWEGELRIHPKGTDAMETRKARIKSMWNLELPYTITWLRQWLSTVSEGLPFEVALQKYTLHIITEWDKDGQVDSIKDLLELITPENIVINSKNSIKCGVENPFYAATGLALCDCIFISDSNKTDISVAVPTVLATGFVACESMALSDASHAELPVNHPLVNPAGIVTAELINISD